MTDIETAWIAGLFEGEGTITIYQKRPTHSPSVSIRIEMVDKDVLEKVQRIVGGKTKLLNRSRENCKPTYRWSLDSREHSLEFLQRVFPHLGERRSLRALEAIKILSKPKYSRFK